MKKYLISFIVACFTLSASSYAEGLDITNWYSYNGYSNLHSFEIRFPSDWEISTLGDNNQGLSPQGNQNDEPFLRIEEHHNKTYDQVIDSYLSSGLSISENKDVMLQTLGEDTIGKKVLLTNSDASSFKALTLVKRGSLIVALVSDNQQELEIIEAIIESFNFTDSWNSYLDLHDNYTFIFPDNLIFTYLSNGVEISITSSIFAILKYENSSIDEAIEESKKDSEVLVGQEEVFFHTGDSAQSVTFNNTKYNKQLGRIYINKGNDVFVLNDINIEDNFPHPNTYDEYIFEMLESFEFFDVDISDQYAPFVNFEDVRDDHPNVEAINALFDSAIIEGYDGDFRPDNQINRAELTKMLVATKLTPSSDEYNNCFEDVAAQWYAPYICYAKDKGWVKGYDDGTFQPGKDINRVEALKIMLEILFDDIADDEILESSNTLDIDTEAWYIKYFAFAENNDLLDKQHIKTSGEGYYFYPGNAITRKEVAETVYRAMKIN
jgi:hypothetical protein